MKITKTFIAEYAKQLPGSKTPALDIEVMLCHVTQLNKIQLIIQDPITLSDKQEQAFFSLLQRRKKGEPVAYLLGEKEFWSLPLKVNRHTLVPRPATECLVDTVLQRFDELSHIHCLDLGTGSGAIALALATERPHWQIDGTDISADALIMAKENSQRHGLKHVNFYQGDWYQALPAGKKYNLIVSNPPYVEKDSPYLEHLTHEPYHALVAEEQGLAALKRVITGSIDHLHPGAMVVVEHGCEQSIAVEKLFKDSKFNSIEHRKDYEGLNRITAARKSLESD